MKVGRDIFDVAEIEPEWLHVLRPEKHYSGVNILISHGTNMSHSHVLANIGKANDLP